MYAVWCIFVDNLLVDVKYEINARLLKHEDLFPNTKRVDSEMQYWMPLGCLCVPFRIFLPFKSYSTLKASATGSAVVIVVLHFAEKLLMNDVSQSIQYVEHSLIAHLNAIFAVPMNEEALESAHRSWCNICELLWALETQFWQRVFCAMKTSLTRWKKGFLFVNWWDECGDLPRIRHLFMPFGALFLAHRKTGGGFYDLCETHFGFLCRRPWIQCKFHVSGVLG